MNGGEVRRQVIAFFAEPRNLPSFFCSSATVQITVAEAWLTVAKYITFSWNRTPVPCPHYQFCAGLEQDMFPFISPPRVLSQHSFTISHRLHFIRLKQLSVTAISTRCWAVEALINPSLIPRTKNTAGPDLPNLHQKHFIARQRLSTTSCQIHCPFQPRFLTPASLETTYPWWGLLFHTNRYNGCPGSTATQHGTETPKDAHTSWHWSWVTPPSRSRPILSDPPRKMTAMRRDKKNYVEKNISQKEILATDPALKPGNCFRKSRQEPAVIYSQ